MRELRRVHRGEQVVAPSVGLQRDVLVREVHRLRDRSLRRHHCDSCFWRLAAAAQREGRTDKVVGLDRLDVHLPLRHGQGSVLAHAHTLEVVVERRDTRASEVFAAVSGALFLLRARRHHHRAADEMIILVLVEAASGGGGVFLLHVIHGSLAILLLGCRGDLLLACAPEHLNLPLLRWTPRVAGNLRPGTVRLGTLGKP
mmetsp:Transcript_40920/g.99182  ORF Transcript_40920/g.99182 Transcript_40920/m.99182 type:complete len:200 (+) Transcript_40920:923-1522(+)